MSQHSRKQIRVAVANREQAGVHLEGEGHSGQLIARAKAVAVARLLTKMSVDGRTNALICVAEESALVALNGATARTHLRQVDNEDAPRARGQALLLGVGALR